MPSFGKDPRYAAGINPYGSGTMAQRERYRLQQNEKARESRKAGGNAPFWKGTFSVPRDHSRIGRLIAGAYPMDFVDPDDGKLYSGTFEYFRFVEHRDPRTSKSAICCAAVASSASSRGISSG